VNLSIEVILVDDGSTDENCVKMRALSLTNSKIQSLIFYPKTIGQQTGNSGRLTGIANANRSCVMWWWCYKITHPNSYTTFTAHFKDGYDVVYFAISKKAKENPIFKYCSTKIFIAIVSNYFWKWHLPRFWRHFHLIQYLRVLKFSNAMPEKEKFIRGMRSWFGFKANKACFRYERDDEQCEKVKYSTKKKLLTFGS